MNTRIRELAGQAKMSTYLLAYGTEFNMAVEKFAELIVRECMRMCEVAQVGYLTHGLEKEASGAFSVKQYIEEYLGVDE
jgi:hypothetical protein